jgi:hypothetical protein
MTRLHVAVALALFASVASALERPTLFITPTADGFETYLTAALLKKEVPITVVLKADNAGLVLTSASGDRNSRVEGGEIAKCAIFLIGCGHVMNAETSVQLTKGEAVVWSYTANEKNRQNLAEDIAKHLKKFLKKGVR